MSPTGAAMPDPKDLLFTAGEAASLLGCGFVGDPGVAVRSVVVDSRLVKPGSLFVALPGERSDGHDFIEKALASGAGCILASMDRRAQMESLVTPSTGRPSSGRAFLFVENTLDALQRLAREHRLRHPRARRIGITGSSGKTTTKECVAAILGRCMRIVVSPGNLNSDIGLPLSMFALDESHEAAIFEMGMNRAGEMGELAWIFEPDLALVTTVGTAHIGILGSRDAIAREKKMIFAHFSGSQRGFVPESEDYTAFLAEGVDGRVETFGTASTPGFLSASSLGLRGWQIAWKDRLIHFPLPGRHNLSNALGAVSISLAAGASTDAIVEGLEAVKPLFGRSELVEGEITLVRDCYNANPESIAAALDACDEDPSPARRIYVLGSMLELGSESLKAHQAMGRRAAGSKAGALFFAGSEAEDAAQAAREAGFSGPIHSSPTAHGLSETLRSAVAPGDLVLLKASRGVGLECLVPVLPGMADPVRAEEDRHAP
jgi:UDP-N-acetylmuramoyl-tripeptide--D-alanyl-D-alanine ligase